MKKFKKIYSCFLLLLCVQATRAQQAGVYDTITTLAIAYEGDTISLKTLENINIYCKISEEQRKAAAKYNRLRNAVYVTYPFARRAGAVMNDINANLIGVKEKEKRLV